MGLVCGVVRHYCLVCAALAAGSGGLGLVPGFVSSPFPPSCPAFPALCVAGRPVRVSLILARWYAIPCGLCVPPARSGCPSGIPRVSFACACARALAASAPPPSSLGRCGACTSRSPGAGRRYGRSTRPVPLRVSRPVLLLRLACLGGWSRSPPAWLGAVRCPWGWSARLGRSSAGGAGGGGSLRAILPDGAAGGASRAGGRLTYVRPSAFPGQATKLVSLGRSGHGGRAPHTAPLRARLLSPGVVRVASLCAGEGLLAHRGPRGSRRLAAWRCVAYEPCCAPPPRGRRAPSRGREDRPSCLRGVGGPAPPLPAGQRGGLVG